MKTNQTFASFDKTMKNTHGGHDLTSGSEKTSYTYPFHRLEAFYRWQTASPSAAEPACKTMQCSAAELGVSEAESKALSAAELYFGGRTWPNPPWSFLFKTQSYSTLNL